MLRGGGARSCARACTKNSASTTPDAKAPWPGLTHSTVWRDISSARVDVQGRNPVVARRFAGVVRQRRAQPRTPRGAAAAGDAAGQRQISGRRSRAARRRRARRQRSTVRGWRGPTAPAATERAPTCSPRHAERPRARALRVVVSCLTAEARRRARGSRVRPSNDTRHDGAVVGRGPRDCKRPCQAAALCALQPRRTQNRAAERRGSVTHLAALVCKLQRRTAACVVVLVQGPSPRGARNFAGAAFVRRLARAYSRRHCLQAARQIKSLI